MAQLVARRSHTSSYCPGYGTLSSGTPDIVLHQQGGIYFAWCAILKTLTVQELSHFCFFGQLSARGAVVGFSDDCCLSSTARRARANWLWVHQYLTGPGYSLFH